MIRTQDYCESYFILEDGGSVTSISKRAFDVINQQNDEIIKKDKQLQQYESIVKAVDPDNLPNWEVLGFNEKDNQFLLGELVSEEDGIYIYYDMTDYMLITYYIEQKDLIKLFNA